VFEYYVALIIYIFFFDFFKLIYITM